MRLTKPIVDHPIEFAFREATENNEIAGTPIPKGAIIALHMAAANRDPRRFDDPDRFLITRPPGKNLALGTASTSVWARTSPVRRCARRLAGCFRTSTGSR